MLQDERVLLGKAAGQGPLRAAGAPSLLAPCCRLGTNLLLQTGKLHLLLSDMDFSWGPGEAVLLFHARLCSPGKLVRIQGFVWLPFLPCLVGLITPKGVGVNYSLGFKCSEKTCNLLFETAASCLPEK